METVANRFLNKKTTLLILIVVGLAISIRAQEEKQFEVACIGFYNLENLFDTIDSPDTRDTEFTPEGRNSWTAKRYAEKLEHMAEVIAQLGSDLTPDGIAVLGVSEIENKTVLEDLVATPDLKPFDFHIVHYDSPDKRGVDVGLLYQPKYLKVTNSASHTLTIEGKDDFYTRDQLVVSGIMMGEKMHFIVNHWPSRRGGQSASQPLRNAAADLTRSIVDSLQKVDRKARIIVMGDFNDDPTDPSVFEHLNAKTNKADLKKNDLYNPTAAPFKKGIGTLAYRDNWNLFDQIVVSAPLVDEDYDDWTFFRFEIFKRKFLLQKEGAYEGYPYRTFAGGRYLGGYSDHFPVYVFLIRELR